jgi:hypothetical protein
MACLSAASLIISTKVRYRLRCGSGRCSNSLSHTEPEMTKRRFAGRLGFALLMAVAFAAPAASAQSAQSAEPQPARAGKLINAGDILSGELTTIKTRGGKRGGKTATYQITSEPRRLPPPNGLCNLETGPETFQLITTSDAQAAELKRFIGKEISVKVVEVSCAENAGQMTEAVITKWSVVK